MRISGSAAVGICLLGALSAPVAQGASPSPATDVKAEHSHSDGAARSGDIEVMGGYAKPMLPGQPVGGGYLVIRNSGAQDDRLVWATSPIADAVETHEMAMDGQTMRMRKLKDGITVAGGSTVELKPGGLHLMFMKVKTPFKAGDTVPLHLRFEKAGEIEMSLPVLAASPTVEHN